MSLLALFITIRKWKYFGSFVFFFYPNPLAATIHLDSCYSRLFSYLFFTTVLYYTVLFIFNLNFKCVYKTLKYYNVVSIGEIVYEIYKDPLTFMLFASTITCKLCYNTKILNVKFNNTPLKVYVYIPRYWILKHTGYKLTGNEKKNFCNF